MVNVGNCTIFSIYSQFLPKTVLKESFTKKKRYKSEFASKQREKCVWGMDTDKAGRELTMLELGDKYMGVPFFS